MYFTTISFVLKEQEGVSIISLTKLSKQKYFSAKMLLIFEYPFESRF